MNVAVSEGVDMLIDPYFYGNCSRFFAHSCNPNLAFVKLYSEHRNLKMPTIAFVTATEIPPLTDLSIDYGDSWWEGRDFGCACGYDLCRHRRGKDGRRLKVRTKRTVEVQEEILSRSSGSDSPISTPITRSPFIRQPPASQVPPPPVLPQNAPLDEEEDETISWDKVPFCKLYTGSVGEEEEVDAELPIEVDNAGFSFPGTVCVATLGCDDISKILDSTGCFSQQPIMDSVERALYSARCERVDGILRSIGLINTRGSVLVILPTLLDCLATIDAKRAGEWNGVEHKPGTDVIAGKIAVHHPVMNAYNPTVERLWSNEFVEIILTTKEFRPTADVRVPSIVVLVSEGVDETMSHEQMESLVENHMSQSGDGLLLLLLDVDG